MVFMTSVKINMAQWMHGVTVQKFLIFLPLLQLSTIKLYVFMVDYLLILIHLVSSTKNKIFFWYRLIHRTCNLFWFLDPLTTIKTGFMLGYESGIHRPPDPNWSQSGPSFWDFFWSGTIRDFESFLGSGQKFGNFALPGPGFLKFSRSWSRLF